MRFLSTKVHGVIDYIVGLVLIAAPWLLGFETIEAAKWSAIGVGAGMIGYSLLTNYELGVYPAISMKTHLWLDALAGAFLAASPWIFEFSEAVYVPHLVVGLLEIGAALVTQTVPSGTAATTGRTSSDIVSETENKVRSMYHKDKGDRDTGTGTGRRAA